MISFIDVLFGEHLKNLARACTAAIESAKTKDDCCEIPETACPPRCTGEIAWKFGRGATPMATIVVRNEGGNTRTFQFAAPPLAGPQGANAILTVVPSSAVLAPGASVHVELKLTHTEALVAGQEYRGEFLYTGSWERCVPIVARVLADPFEKRALEQTDTPPAVMPKHHHSPSPSPIVWKAQRGVTTEAQLVLRNMGAGPRTFTIATSPLTGIDANTATLSLSKVSIELASREHQVVTVKLENTSGLQPRQVYEAYLLVEGYYEDRLPLSCTIEPDATAYVQVAQGDPPTRVRAHHWYHHFECTVPCAEHAITSKNEG